MSNLRIGDVINFTNIDNEDFIGKWGGEEYLIKAGETKIFPDFLTRHFAKHLVDKMLLKTASKDYANKEKRAKLEEQMIGKVVVEAKKEEKKSSAKELKETTEKIQKEFADLDEKTPEKKTKK